MSSCACTPPPEQSLIAKACVGPAVFLRHMNIYIQTFGWACLHFSYIYIDLERTLQSCGPVGLACLAAAAAVPGDLSHVLASSYESRSASAHRHRFLLTGG